MIHTDEVAGLQESIGHQDFYPNSGKIQPGCYLKKIEDETPSEHVLRSSFVGFLSCSHTRVKKYYAESINSNCNFESVLCDSWGKFQFYY